MKKKILLLSLLIGSTLSPVQSMAAPVPVTGPHLSKDWTMRQYGNDSVSQAVLFLNLAAPQIHFTHDSCIHFIPGYLLHHISDTAREVHTIKVYSDHTAPVTVVETEFPATPQNRETVREMVAIAHTCAKLDAANPQDVFGYKLHMNGNSIRTNTSTTHHLILTHYSAQGAVLLMHQGRPEINYAGKIEGVLGESHRNFFIIGQGTPQNGTFVDLTPWIEAQQ